MIALAIILIAYYLFKPALVEPPSTATVTRGNVHVSVYASGTLAPRKQVVISSQAVGQIKKIYVKLGDNVKKGDLLAEIDDEAARQTVDRARANYLLQQATLKAQESLVILRQREFERTQQLAALDVVTEEDLDRAKSDLQNALSNRDVGKANVDISKIGVSQSQIELKYTQITAPFDGEVTVLLAHEGQTFVASQTSPNILILSDMERMVLYSRISEADVLKIHQGQQLKFTTPTSVDREYSAHIKSVETSPTNALSSGSSNSAIEYNVLANVDNQHRELRPGMRAEVVINLASAENALLLPVSALNKSISANRYEVVRLNQDGSQEKIVITVGLTNETEAEVLAGLNEGDQILTGPLNAADNKAK